jgi:5'-3' exonuclease
MLIGDRADNVIGVEGIGTVKAGRAISPLHDEKDMYSLVHSLYNDDERFKRNAQLLWILKHKRDPQEVLSHFHTLHAPDEEAKQ